MSRPFVSACLGTAAVLLALGAPAASAAPRLFAPDSIWNTAIPASADLAPGSARRVGTMASNVRTTIARTRVYPNIQSHTYSTPIYRVARNTPRVPVKVHTDPSGKGFIAVAAAGVPIPTGATPAAGTDGHITIYQPATDTLWEFWRANRQPDGWHASWGGAIRNVSKSPGYYTPNAWPNLPPNEGWNWGSTATSLPVAGGTVTTQELRNGRIDHALAVSLPNPCRGVFSWPAQDSDGTSDDRNCIPEGARLRLDPRIDLDSLRLTPVARTLARAAQRYGMIVRDKTGGSIAFYLETPTGGGPSPYLGARGLYRGVAPWRQLLGFPWHRLQLLPMHTCTTAPCVPPAT